MIIILLFFIILLLVYYTALVNEISTNGENTTFLSVWTVICGVIVLAISVCVYDEIYNNGFKDGANHALKNPQEYVVVKDSTYVMNVK
jgi:heme/copper-type cytochrome/quinol oxidase subunit 2